MGGDGGGVFVADLADYADFFKNILPDKSM
jgi:hypothetical protein